MEENDSHNCMRSEHDCMAMMEKVTMSLDGELSHEEEVALMEEIQLYPCCLKKMHIAQSYKVFLCTKIQKKEVPNNLMSRIRTAISNVSV